jgi:cytochrome c oxidase assembly factor CtaG
MVSVGFVMEKINKQVWPYLRKKILLVQGMKTISTAVASGISATKPEWFCTV